MTEKTVAIAIPMLLRGGTEIQTLALVRVLKEQGYRVIVYCYYEHEKEIEAEFRSAGAIVQFLNLDRSAATFRVRPFVLLLWTLVKTFRTEMPEIVHVQYVSPGLVPILAARLAGVKRVFATIHYPRHKFGKREQRFVRIATQLCSLFICNSLATERSWFGSGSVFDNPGFEADRAHCTIYNSIEGDKIENLAASTGKQALRTSVGVKKKNVIGIVARLRSEKGHLFLFRAMASVLRAVPDTVLVIVGDGPDKALLQSSARALEIGENIVWVGAKSHDETLRLYGIMDVAVVPSEFEGFGLSAAEAMAAGLPIVASDVDGLREVVDDGKTGYLVPFGHTAKMDSSITSLLLERKRAHEMGIAGRQRVKEFFLLARFHNAIAKVYAQH